MRIIEPMVALEKLDQFLPCQASEPSVKLLHAWASSSDGSAPRSMQRTSLRTVALLTAAGRPHVQAKTELLACRLKHLEPLCSCLGKWSAQE